jgi:MFS family permease
MKFRSSLSQRSLNKSRMTKGHNKGNVNKGSIIQLTNSNSSIEIPEYNYVAHEDDASNETADISSPMLPTSTDTTMCDQMQQKSNFQRTYTIILYSLTTVLLFADQNLLAPNLSAAAEEFGYDNDQRDKKLGGDIALAFFVLGAPASFLVGCAADSDHIPRSFLFGLVVLIGEGACFATYFTTTYAGLYITRAMTGFSVGGALPLLSSVLGDWFPPEQRSGVMASVGVGVGIGISLGQGLAGFLGPTYGWRSPFLVVSIPALLIAVLVMATVKDPVRGGCENLALTASTDDTNDNNNSNNKNGNMNIDANDKNEYGNGNQHHDFEEDSDINGRENIDAFGNNTNENTNENKEHPRTPLEMNTPDRTITEQQQKSKKAFPSLLKMSTYSSHITTTKELLQSKTVLLSLVQGAPGCVPWGIVNTFLNDYLSEDCGLSIQSATSIILVFGIGNFFGMVLGGAGGDYLYKKDPSYPSLLSGTMAILGCFPLWILVNTTNVPDDGEVSTWMIIRTSFIALMAGLGSGVTGPIVKATLQNVTLPHARGQAFALLNTFDDFGRGLGPVFVAALIVSLGGRQVAFNVGIAGWVLCGVFNLCIFWTVKSDEERTKQKFLQRYATSTSSGQDDELSGTVV